MRTGKFWTLGMAGNHTTKREHMSTTKHEERMAELQVMLEEEQAKLAQAKLRAESAEAQAKLTETKLRASAEEKATITYALKETQLRAASNEAKRVTKAGGEGKVAFVSDLDPHFGPTA